jgi:hypothetical protein
MTQGELQAALNLIVNGDAGAWRQGYYDVLFRQVMDSRILDGVPLLDYEYKRRDVLYGYVNNEVLGNRQVDYLEFGVAGGDSLRKWLNINQYPESRFFGFDTFEGLPENWLADRPKGSFSAKGEAPPIPDPRVRFVKGLFQETLPGFLKWFKPRNQLVVHIDCDLFTASLYALMALDRLMPKGTVILFDEFLPKDEFAAFHTYSETCYRTWEVLAARRDLVKLAVRLTS